MSRKYIDFVPSNKVKAPKVSTTKKAKAKEVDDFAVREIFAERKKTPKYGVIEDFSDKFVERSVEKRPLNHKVEKIEKPVAKKTPEQIEMERQAAIAKAKRISIMKMSTTKTKSAPKVTDEALAAAVKKASKDDKTMKLPQAKFVNTEKVEKRPLSKNVYQKKIVAPKEEPKGPVTIIQKPEKDSKVGLIVTIIITIILGAAVGTVAFLLFPK